MPVLQELAAHMAAQTEHMAQTAAMLTKLHALQGEEMLTVEGVAQQWPGLLPDTIRTYCRQGKLKCTQLVPGGTYYIRRAEIARLVHDTNEKGHANG